MSRLMLRERDLAVLRQTLGRFPFVAEARPLGPRATGPDRRPPLVHLPLAGAHPDRPPPARPRPAPHDTPRP